MTQAAPIKCSVILLTLSDAYIIVSGLGAPFARGLPYLCTTHVEALFHVFLRARWLGFSQLCDGATSLRCAVSKTAAGWNYVARLRAFAPRLKLVAAELASHRGMGILPPRFVVRKVLDKVHSLAAPDPAPDSDPDSDPDPDPDPDPETPTPTP